MKQYRVVKPAKDIGTYKSGDANAVEQFLNRQAAQGWILKQYVYLGGPQDAGELLIFEKDV